MKQDSTKRFRMMRRFLRTAAIVAAIQLFGVISAFAFHLDPPLDPEPPFVICENRYALCAAASCFVYNGLAYCKCDIKPGDSISLQLDYTSPLGERNVCDVNLEGRTNGYMVSTFSLPDDVLKGGPAAVYTCPGSADSGNGVIAPGRLWPMRRWHLLQEHQDPSLPGFYPSPTGE